MTSALWRPGSLASVSAARGKGAGGFPSRAGNRPTPTAWSRISAIRVAHPQSRSAGSPPRHGAILGPERSNPTRVGTILKGYLLETYLNGPSPRAWGQFDHRRPSCVESSDAARYGLV
jgi:hypothetical protein